MAKVIGSKQTAGFSIYVQRWQRWQSDIEKNAELEVEKNKVAVFHHFRLAICAGTQEKVRVYYSLKYRSAGIAYQSIPSHFEH